MKEWLILCSMRKDPGPGRTLCLVFWVGVVGQDGFRKSRIADSFFLILLRLMLRMITFRQLMLDPDPEWAGVRTQKLGDNNELR